MKIKFSTLQLLSLCQFVAASPCKPVGSSATTGLTTTESSITTESVPVSETASPLSSTVTETEPATTDSVFTSETATVSESATTFEAITTSDTEAALTESITSSEATTTSQAAAKSQITVTTTSGTENESIATSEGTVSSQATTASEIEIDTATTETVTTFDSATTSEAITTSDMPVMSTTSAKPTTTTPTLPQEPTNLLRNPSFEDDTISPWVRWNNLGTLSLSTTQARTGAQSGFITARSPGGNPTSYGFAQDIDVSLLEAGKPYEFSAYTKATFLGTCIGNRIISCITNRSTYISFVSYGPGEIDWDYMKITCVWTQAQLDSGPRVAVTRQCRGLDWYINDAMLVEAI